MSNLGQTIVNTLQTFNGDNGKAWTWGQTLLEVKMTQVSKLQTLITMLIIIFSQN